MLKTSRYFSFGISIKLFLSFWLVVIVSAVLTQIISAPFDDLVVQQVPHKNKATLLKKTLETLLADPEKNLLTEVLPQTADEKAKKKAARKFASLSKLQRMFYVTTNHQLILQRDYDKKIFTPRENAWQDNIWGDIAKYIEVNQITTPVTIRFPFTLVTGPEEVTINGNKFYSYIATPYRGQGFDVFVRQLPFWLRIILALFISFTLCWLLAQTLSKPLLAIQNAATNIGKGKFSTRLRGFDKRRDELGDLAISFNSMAEQLENNITAHQRLMGDVSHELRSPLTRLQMAVAMAEKSISNPEEQAKHLTRCEQEVERLDVMIGDVLTLSRLEHSSMMIHIAEFNFTQLLIQIIDDYQYQANEKNVNITLVSPDVCYVKADEKLIASAISNVINNAVKYAPGDSIIAINVKKSGKTLYLEVTDNGPGVPEGVLEKLFSPFFRVADSRDRKTGGTGLGLAIAQQAISHHNGEIYAQNNPQGGLIVFIKFPVGMN